MAMCADCKSYFALPDDPLKGDCVIREKDARCDYWSARPTDGTREAGGCPRFIARDDPKKIEELAEARTIPLCESEPF